MINNTKSSTEKFFKISTIYIYVFKLNALETESKTALTCETCGGSAATQTSQTAVLSFKLPVVNNYTARHETVRCGSGHGLGSFPVPALKFRQHLQTFSSFI